MYPYSTCKGTNTSKLLSRALLPILPPRTFSILCTVNRLIKSPTSNKIKSYN